MKNADKPINPTTSQKINETEFFEYELPDRQRQYSGLTKREYFAGLALQGFCSNQEFMSNLGKIELISRFCIEIAEELLKQLEENE